MKFQFLKRFFLQNQAESNPNQKAEEITDKELNELFEAIVEEEPIEGINTTTANKNAEFLKSALIIQKPLVEKKTRATADFQIIKEINGSTFELDESNKISRVTWIGQINRETASTLLTLGADSVEFLGYKKLIVDRYNLVEFDPETRIWIKELLKTRARKIANMVDKLGMIKAKTAKGSIFSNFISSAIGVIIPSLEMRKFDNVEEAVDWLL